MKVLFVASEAYPLMKTGGLGDVCGSLPPALKALGVDVRLLLPAYHDTVKRAGKLTTVARLQLANLATPVTLLEGTLPGTRVKFWLVDFPPAYDRPGNPYMNAYGHPWHDNAARFALLARAAVAIAQGNAGLAWRPDIVHCHDWQSGLVPALLAQSPEAPMRRDARMSRETGRRERPATVFTIHNLAYQGVFPYETFTALHLPEPLWSLHGLEFHGQLSFIKGGLAYADHVTAVSPNYAREIQLPTHGLGLDGLLHHRRAALHGILNGIDTDEWNPARDKHLAKSYSATRFAGKAANKRALQRAFGLPPMTGVLLVGMVGRLVAQKGIDLLLDALPRLEDLPLQLVILGTGEAQYEKALQAAAVRYSGWLALRIGYDEATAHRIQAGADAFLMPSRFEPCGLAQLHSLRYGTVPIVRRVGGLADTVVNTSKINLARNAATGFTFDGERPADLVAAVERAHALYRDAPRWKKLALNGMRQDFSWRHSAADYRQLYQQCLGGLFPTPPTSALQGRSNAAGGPGGPGAASIPGVVTRRARHGRGAN